MPSDTLTLVLWGGLLLLFLGLCVLAVLVAVTLWRWSAYTEQATVILYMAVPRILR